MRSEVPRSSHATWETGSSRPDPITLLQEQAKGRVPELLPIRYGRMSAPFAGRSEFDNQGQRVVEGQRLMQAASDIFLGWLRTTDIDGESRDFYLRQLWDWKGSAEITKMRSSDMTVYARLCAWTLARAHARSGDAIAIAAYLGSGDVFDRAIAEFAET
jgi:hypothetical protein